MSQPETIYGPWDYREAKQQHPYDDTPSYRISAEWLDGHGAIEDWGCGYGWFQTYVPDAEYRGVDGAWSRWADRQADLRSYRSETPCAMMRHVLEHNYDWRQIAENFQASWTVRAALVLFIPPQPEDYDTGDETWPVPDLAVSGPDLFAILGDTLAEVIELTYPPENTIQWGWEAVILMER